MSPNGDTTGPMLHDADWLRRPETQAVFAAIAAAGHEARAVGGAVRNALIGREVVDIDLATTAPPEVVTRAAAAAGLHAVPTGIAHGTVTVVSGHIPYEVTTLREDVETFGRHARVAFTADWVSDAKRRDFTMNALYCDAQGQVHDPIGGYGDLLAGRVRFIGDALARIGEDALRILRFFRFNAEYGGAAPDADGLAACVARRGMLARLSGERLRAELMRLVVAPRAVAMAEIMSDAGILDEVLTRPLAPDALGRLAAIEAGLARVPDPVLRLAVLCLARAGGAGMEAVTEAGGEAGSGGGTGSPREALARRLAERLRMSSAEARRFVGVSSPLAIAGAKATLQEVRVALYRGGREWLVDGLLVAWAEAGDPPDHRGRREVLAAAETLAIPELPVRGADILALGVRPGPRVGEVLGQFEAWWIEAGMPDDPALVQAQLAALLATK